ncbi:DgyrCDS776 [Dimorphilus gyrociliatus]|uniref:Gamma-glutamylcyclotransferase family protein n=1 Tax=Dimorphilus gyrociliatus TaxID=2664684 RepID=A0A7I8VA60_9ANNE|nr:DgyrCDS776 [Dimorphilus gyrociliatus]
MAAGKHLMFVYGTLKRNQPNYIFNTSAFDGISIFRGKGRTVEKFPLVIATKYNVPYVLDSPGRGNNIEGEVYEIDDKRLKIYDDLELYPINYNKKQIQVKLKKEIEDEEHSDNNHEILQCNIYIITDFKKELLSKPVLSNYDDNLQENKYVTGENRYQFDNLNYDTKCDVKENWPKIETNNPNLPIPIFVYGTLKIGEHYHKYLKNPEKGKAEFVGEAETNTKYPLVVESKYNLPYLLWSPNNGNNVKGEVYNIDKDLLAWLDEFEDHPKTYIRLPSLVKINGVLKNCWCYFTYFLKTIDAELLSKPTLESYSQAQYPCLEIGW